MKFFQSCLLGFALTGSQIAQADEPRPGEPAAKTAAGKTSDNKKAEIGYVSVSRALVYSGPSEDFYPTQQLALGTSLEVYHQTKTGWLAIRPPSGSFSWIPATDGYLLPGGRSIEITAKNSVSWIGSSLGTAKQYRWQVQLNVGEQLTKLGEETIKDKDGKETLWYKIAPPNGEFRWIQTSAVSNQPPENLNKQSAEGSSDVVTASAQATPAQKTSNEKTSNQTASDKSSKSKNAASQSASVKTASAGGPVVQNAAPKNSAGKSTNGNNSLVSNTSTKNATVKNAAHSVRQEEVSGVVVEGNSPQPGVIVDEGNYVEGSYIDEGYSGEISDGEVIYDGEYSGDGEIIYESDEPQYDAHWNDWQLFEFTDQGLRLPFLEKAAAWRKKQPDPLAADPFSLSMAPKQKGRPRPEYDEEPMQMAPPRRRTPWRDPRELSELRMMGYPQASGERGFGTTLSALRGTMDQTRETIRENFGSSEVMGTGFNSRSSELGPWSARSRTNGMSPEPKSAPPVDLTASTESSSSSSSSSGSSGSNSGSSNGYGSTSSIVTSGGNVAGGSMGSDNGGAGAGNNWAARNWYGVGNRNSSDNTDRPGMLDAGNSAVMQLQQRLSEMVTRPMQQWNFGELKEKVQYYINNGSSPSERGQARLLLERIGEFERHAMRTGYSLSSLNGGAQATQGSSIVPVGVSSGGVSSGMGQGSNQGPVVTTASYTAPASGSSGDTMAIGNFDATGWLVPVHAAQPGQPTHALQSDSGQIIAYVTALPGMNLGRFVNQAVGIHGLRGYLPEFRAAHIEAQNITRLR